MTGSWQPPNQLSRDDVIAASNRVLSGEERPFIEREDVFRIHVAGYDWDIGGVVYQPEGEVARGPDGQKIGAFLLHGGAGDHRSMAPTARVLAGRFGFKVATLTFPGQLNLERGDRRWPGDTINADGSVRLPQFQVGHPITRDQYVVVEHTADPRLRARHGTMYFAKALEGTEFYHRLAAWPLVYEAALLVVCQRNFPESEYSIYAHGHSTGGPLVHMLLQRLSNIRGLIGLETSPFGVIFSDMLAYQWPFPFNYMTVRTWRDTARYRGREAGLDGVARFPWLMEQVFEEWEREKDRPNIKFQDLIQFNAESALREAASITADRLALAGAERAELIARYLNYPRPLTGEGTRDLPPLFYSIVSGSVDHRPERYLEQLLPRLKSLPKPPRTAFVVFDAGVHSYWLPEPDLPVGVVPAAAGLWAQAIETGFFNPDA